MDLIGFVFIVLSIISLLFSIVLFLLGYDYGFPFSGLSIMFLSIFLLLAGILIIVLSFRSFLGRLNNSHFALSKKISNHWNASQTIVFQKNKKLWECRTLDGVYEFNLRNCFFEKSFLTAFVIRAVRYSIISNKMPVYYLGKVSLTGYKKNVVTYIRFIMNSRTKSKNVIKNGKSKCPLIPWLIIKSKMPSRYERFKPINKSFGSQIIPINEENYVNYL